MAKINSCLRYTFITFNLVIATLGCLLLIGVLGGTIYIHTSGYFDYGIPGLIWAWLLCFGIIGLSSLGAYGGIKERRVPLIVFASLMGIAAVVMFGFGIQAVTVFQQLSSHFDYRMSDDSLINYVVQVSLGIYFGLGVVALLGMLMSILMVHQIRRREDALNAFLPMRSTSGDPTPMLADDKPK